MNRTLSVVYLSVVAITAILLAGHHKSILSDADLRSLLIDSDETLNQARESITREIGNKALIIRPGNQGLRKLEQTQQEINTLPGIDLVQDSVVELAKFYWPYRYQLVSTDLSNKLQVLTPEEFASQRFSELLQPFSRSLLNRPFLEDPFGIHEKWMLSLWNPSASFSPTKIPSVVDRGKHYYLLALEIDTALLSKQSNQFLNSLVIEMTGQSAKSAPSLLLSGMIFHQLYGKSLARKEMTTIGAFSLVCTALLLFGFFNGWRSFVFVFSVLISSMVVAVGATRFVFGGIHPITLIFGTTLLGVAVDYCFHLLAKYYKSGNGRSAGLSVRKALIVSVISTSAAYLVQLLVPVNIVQQFAVFIVSGLITAGLGVVCLSSLLPNTQVDGENTKQALFQTINQRIYYPASQHSLVRKGMVMLPVLLSILLFLNYKTDDDIGSLNTSPNALLQSESKVNQLTGGNRFGQYFLTHADTPESVLAISAQLTGQLWPNLAYNISTYMPPVQQQAEHYRNLKEYLYGEKGAWFTLCRLLNISCDSPPPVAPFTPLQYDQLKNAGLIPPGLSIQNNTSIVRLSPAARASFAKKAAAVAEETPGVTWVDERFQYNQQLKNYRLNISGLLAGFFVLFILAVILFYREKSHQLYLVPTISCLIALNIVAPGGITLFHILAIFLVFGLSIDANAFFLEGGYQYEVWWAVLISGSASLLVFGLLGLSAVAVLSQFGVVIFVGLLSSVLLTPLVFAPTDQPPAIDNSGKEST